MRGRPNVYTRLFRGETSFDFAGRWRRWFAISGLVIVIGFVALGVRGLNFSIEFKGGTVWEVPSTASVTDVRGVISPISPTLSQANVQTLIDRQSGKRVIQVSAPAKETANSAEVAKVTDALAKIGHTSANNVRLNDIGPSWGSDITTKAVRAVIIFLVVVTAYIWLRFEAKMALAALVALVHDILVTVGIYSLSGFQVSPDTVIAFLTILGYSLYDTIVVFDKVQENTKGLASTGRTSYTETVNLSMNQVLARSLNTSFVAIIPILSILVIGAGVLGAKALEDFGLALFIGLSTGAYSSIFIASPLLALLKEREPRYAQIRNRLAKRSGTSPMTPATAAASGQLTAREAPATASGRSRPVRATRRSVDDFDSRPDGKASHDAPAPRGGPSPTNGVSRVRVGNRGALKRRIDPDAAPADADAGSDAEGGGGDRPSTDASLQPRGPTAVPPRPNRTPPRPRKKRRR